MEVPVKEILTNGTVIVAAISAIFYTGGFVLLTRNHLAHLAKDIKRILKGQRYLRRRVSRIERRLK